ncbi:MAG: response regulator [Planctomycetota bacterium]|nr:response regulator [Planctomycetota bacterium]MCX8040115.1 response regulator [Planctomycetota bacterium]MDW8373427.1 response regulator [Planctomycetota bacterium]
MPDAPFLTLGAVAKRCNVSRTTVYRWIVSGLLKAHCLPSGHFRVAEEDLQAFCQQFHIPAGTEPAVEGQRLRVLVADDHPDARQLFVRIVQRALPEAAIIEADNGVTTCVQIGALCPDILLLDIMMPGMDGFAVLHDLLHRPQLASSRVVIVTAYEPFERVAELQRLHRQVVACLRKPFRVEELSAALREAALPLDEVAPS